MRPAASGGAGLTRRQCLAGGLGLAGLAGCASRPPLHLGFLGALSQGAADVGTAGRRGVTLAIEQCNSAGGVQGQAVRLTIEDHGQQPEQAARAFETLRQAGVHAVIGPFTSGMAEVVLPLANAAGLLLVSPTVTSMDFYGIDDQLVRLHRTTRDNASDYALQLVGRGQRRVAVLKDQVNRSFAESWFTEFERALAARGGQVVRAEAFRADDSSNLDGPIKALLATRPDVLLMIANTVDTVRLGQRARLLQPGLPLAAAEWAATENLLELGGDALEGLLILHPFDREDRSPRYQAFALAYEARYSRAPGYASVAAFDAVTVLTQGEARRQPTQSLKQSLLANGPFDGLQQQISFTAQGDTTRKVVFAEVRSGRFVVLR